MNDAKREILAKVAAGTLTAQEAALELEELDDPAASPEPFVTPSGGGAPAGTPWDRRRSGT